MRQLIAILAVTAATAVTLVDCSADGHADSRTVYPQGKGALSATAAEGGTSVNAPKHVPYYATFGDYVLCNRENAHSITIDGVRVDDAQDPAIAVDVYVRTVTPSQVPSDPGTDLLEYAPFISALGSPPNFHQPYVKDYRPRGQYSRHIEGLQITQTCEQANRGAAEASSGRNPTSPYTSLVFSLKSGPEGGVVKQFFVDYTIDGHPSTLRVNWEMVACGSHITDPQICS